MLAIAGIKYQEKNDYARAEYYYKEAIAVCKKHKLQKQLGSQLYNLASLYGNSSNFEMAEKLSMQSIAIFKQFKDTRGMAKCYINLEHCYTEQDRTIEAREYAELAVKALRETKNDTLLVRALWRSANVYSEINTALAIPMLEESLLLAKKTGQYEKINHIYTSLGSCYADNVFGSNFNPALAHNYFRLALRSAEKYDIESINDARIQYAKSCTVNNNTKDATYYLNLVYNEALKAKDTDNLSVAAFCLSEVYYNIKDYKKAFYYLKQHEELETIYQQGEKKIRVNNMAFNFKSKKIQEKHKLLQKQNALQKIKTDQQSYRKKTGIIIAVALTLFLLTSTYLAYRYLKKRSLLISKKGDILRQKLLLIQMNPHFIAASVTNIQTLIQQEQPEQAANYLSKFARLTRQILENSAQELITLDEELNMITNYLTVQQLLYTEGFNFKMECDEAIDAEATLIPPMLTQPLLEYAIKRVMQAGIDNRFILVNFYLKNGKLLFVARDNGPALLPGEEKAILWSDSVKIVTERLAPNNPYPIKITNIFKDGVITGVSASFEITCVQDI